MPFRLSQIMAVVIVLFSTAAMAEAPSEKAPEVTVKNFKDAVSGKTTPEQIKELKENQDNCAKLMEHIRSDMESVRECYQDSDCTTISFGCPWQLSPCHQSVISRSNPEKEKELLERMKNFQTECIQRFEDVSSACDAFNKKVDAAKCKPLEVFCVSGKCVNQMELRYQDPQHWGEMLEKGYGHDDDIKPGK